MSSWNYYIEVKANEELLNHMILEYNKNSTYKKVFHFGVIQNSCNDSYTVGFVSTIDNFLQANYLIYNFLFNYIAHNLYIKTNGTECIFNFTKKSDFIKFMYDAWESKIDYIYNQLGVIIIDYKQYPKIRNKLYKKYYIKIEDGNTGDGSSCYNKSKKHVD